ncbi:MAG: tRNA glutamyl-Q(34) synthetase GluQRS [Alphaproteobacteria bacterium]|nr:tRNA glutamyl-Q(34) synthetase GluQRS [Alphaproteobacteria bacterium]
MSVRDKQPVFRFAPSPNGRLHLGHAYSALFTAEQARKAGGRLLLRIEDIDLLRCRSEFIDGIFEDLTWLGLSWEVPVRRQSEHFETYRQAISTLKNVGVLYPCYATRAEIRAAVEGKADHPRDPDGAPVYPGLYRSGEAPSDPERPYALRLNHALAIKLVRKKLGGRPTFLETGCGTSGETGELPVTPEIWGDVVLARKDIGTSYHVSVVVDDALQGITHVTRGQDLFAATHIHRVLQILLDLPEPTYCHHPLISDTAGRKLSKSSDDQSLASLREAGVTAGQIKHELGFT